MSIKNMFYKARSKISIKTYKRPQLFIILMMLMINIIILMIAAIIALIIDDEFTSLLDAFANGSLKWMLTPNAILLIENPNTLILAVIVLIIGMILFTGTIIALTTNAIKDYFQKKKSGSGKLLLDHQIVILNWNHKVPDLVADLIHLDEEEIYIVILADINKDEAEKLIINAIKSVGKDIEMSHLNILVKQGNPLIKTDLEDISIDKARTILIMNIDSDNQDKKTKTDDLNMIKTILNLGEIDFEYHPPIVAEIKHIESKEKVLALSKVVKSLHEHIIIPICFDRLLGYVIAQTIINPLIKDVYLSMFSFQDAEVYFIKHENFNAYLKEYSHAIPISTHKDGLYVLAEKEKDIYLKSPHSLESIIFKTKKISFKSDKKITIVGKNNKLQFIQESFNEYKKIYNSDFDVTYLDDVNLESHQDVLFNDIEHKTLLLLSHEFDNSEHLDANIINNLIYIQSHLTTDANIIVEVLDPINDHIIKDFKIKNTIISNRIISLLISKIILYKETAPFYENLLTIKSDVTGNDEQNIFIMKASEMFDETFPLAFQSKKQLITSFYDSFEQKLMLIGYYNDEELTMIYGDLHQKSNLSINHDDLLVFTYI